MNNFDWKEFLNIAKENFAHVSNLKQVEMNDEALCRIGISRAYYAAFHQAAALVDFETQTGGTHEKVIHALKSSDIKTLRQIGNNLNALRKMRVQADYDSARYPPRGLDCNAVLELQLAIDYAETIFRKIAAL